MVSRTCNANRNVYNGRYVYNNYDNIINKYNSNNDDDDDNNNSTLSDVIDICLEPRLTVTCLPSLGSSRTKSYKL